MIWCCTTAQVLANCFLKNISIYFSYRLIVRFKTLKRFEDFLSKNVTFFFSLEQWYVPYVSFLRQYFRQPFHWFGLTPWCRHDKAPPPLNLMRPHGWGPECTCFSVFHCVSSTGGRGSAGGRGTVSPEPWTINRNWPKSSSSSMRGATGCWYAWTTSRRWEQAGRVTAWQRKRETRELGILFSCQDTVISTINVSFKEFTCQIFSTSVS